MATTPEKNKKGPGMWDKLADSFGRGKRWEMEYAKLIAEDDGEPISDQEVWDKVKQLGHDVENLTFQQALDIASDAAFKEQAAARAGDANAAEQIHEIGEQAAANAEAAKEVGDLLDSVLGDRPQEAETTAPVHIPAPEPRVLAPREDTDTLPLTPEQQRVLQNFQMAETAKSTGNPIPFPDARILQTIAPRVDDPAVKAALSAHLDREKKLSALAAQDATIHQDTERGHVARLLAKQTIDTKTPQTETTSPPVREPLTAEKKVPLQLTYDESVGKRNDVKQATSEPQKKEFDPTRTYNTVDLHHFSNDQLIAEAEAVTQHISQNGPHSERAKEVLHQLEEEWMTRGENPTLLYTDTDIDALIDSIGETTITQLPDQPDTAAGYTADQKALLDKFSRLSKKSSPMNEFSPAETDSTGAIEETDDIDTPDVEAEWIRKIAQAKEREGIREKRLQIHKELLAGFDQRALAGINTIESFAFGTRTMRPGEMYQLTDPQGEALSFTIVGHDPVDNHLITTGTQPWELLPWSENTFAELVGKKDWKLEQIQPGFDDISEEEAAAAVSTLSEKKETPQSLFSDAEENWFHSEPEEMSVAAGDKPRPFEATPAREKQVRPLDSVFESIRAAISSEDEEALKTAKEALEVALYGEDTPYPTTLEKMKAKKLLADMKAVYEKKISAVLDQIEDMIEQQILDEEIDHAIDNATSDHLEQRSASDADSVEIDLALDKAIPQATSTAPVAGSGVMQAKMRGNKVSSRKKEDVSGAPDALDDRVLEAEVDAAIDSAVSVPPKTEGISEAEANKALETIVSEQPVKRATAPRQPEADNISIDPEYLVDVAVAGEEVTAGPDKSISEAGDIRDMEDNVVPINTASQKNTPRSNNQQQAA